MHLWPSKLLHLASLQLADVQTGMPLFSTSRNFSGAQRQEAARGHARRQSCRGDCEANELFSLGSAGCGAAHIAWNSPLGLILEA